MNSRIRISDFGAIPDMHSVAKQWNYKGLDLLIKERQGTDNDEIIARVSKFLSNSQNVSITIDGDFFTTRPFDIWNAENLTMKGGSFTEGLYISNSSYCLVKNVSVVGFHEIHDFPRVCYYKDYISDTVFNVSEGIYNLGLSHGIIVTSSKDKSICHNLTFEKCYVEMSQQGIALGSDRTTDGLCYNNVIRKCRFDHIYYQPVGTHANHTLIEDIYANYSLEAVDISTISHDVTVKRVKAYKNCCGPKIETRNEVRNTCYNNIIEDSYFEIDQKWYVDPIETFLFVSRYGLPESPNVIRNTTIKSTVKLQGRIKMNGMLKVENCTFEDIEKKGPVFYKHSSDLPAELYISSTVYGEHGKSNPFDDIIILNENSR